MQQVALVMLLELTLHYTTKPEYVEERQYWYSTGPQWVFYTKELFLKSLFWFYYHYSWHSGTVKERFYMTIICQRNSQGFQVICMTKIHFNPTLIEIKNTVWLPGSQYDGHDMNFFISGQWCYGYPTCPYLGGQGMVDIRQYRVLFNPFAIWELTTSIFNKK